MTWTADSLDRRLLLIIRIRRNKWIQEHGKTESKWRAMVYKMVTSTVLWKRLMQWSEETEQKKKVYYD